jgi:addiction module HigA family antidote
MPIRRDDLASLDLADTTTGERLPPVPPGEVLAEEFMKPLGISARSLARDLDVPHNRILGILSGTRAITAATALRLGRRFNTSAEFWMNLQTAHDLELARAELAAA